ncbi:MAG TPA: FAD-dependent thymidylate synthase [bacterium]|nr:FAD-dependent thymidylate synthase [bacterium]HOL55500.1 FAD-dependent thymidylate synthase [bacterium]HPO82958.1 FAD-dependent thymidylate synthase [bacterium]
MKVELLSYTPEPDRVVAISARLCYSKIGISELAEKLTDDKIKDLLKKLESSGHLSPFEHANFTFGIEGISRVTSHQLVRHRIASYSQQSQRYVKMSNGEFVIPPSIKKNSSASELVYNLNDMAMSVYNKLIQLGIPEEDARYILPQGITTKIIVTMNARELLHFFNLRCCLRAQWEIRAMANLMLRKVKEVAPIIFEKAGPSCFSGPCPEEGPCPLKK